MALYLKAADVIEFLKDCRQNVKTNNSPYIDNALLNVQELIEINAYNPCIFDFVEIGDCQKCKWKNRHQKCSCCRRNRYMRDLYETE